MACLDQSCIRWGVMAVAGQTGTRVIPQTATYLPTGDTVTVPPGARRTIARTLMLVALSAKVGLPLAFPPPIDVLSLLT